MADYTTPNDAPYPRSSLGYDGADFRVARCNAAATRIVRGEDQLFSFKTIHREVYIYTIVDEETYTFLGATPPADEVWVITSLLAVNASGATPTIRIGILTGGVNYNVGSGGTVAMDTGIAYSGWIPMVNGDRITGLFEGAAVGDVLRFYGQGFEMTLEA